MNKKQKFVICKHCGNLATLIDNQGIPLSCCGSAMTEFVPNTVDASNEKHVPEVKVSGDKMSVAVGSVAHPMTDEHYIGFIYVETAHGGQFKRLSPGDAPAAEFSFADDTPITVYEYCNLHGLWSVEV